MWSFKHWIGTRTLNHVSYVFHDMISLIMENPSQDVFQHILFGYAKRKAWIPEFMYSTCHSQQQ